MNVRKRTNGSVVYRHELFATFAGVPKFNTASRSIFFFFNKRWEQAGSTALYDYDMAEWAQATFIKITVAQERREGREG